MVVVDAMRFPFIEGGGTAGPPVTIGTNAIFSSQRCQPFRGGHAVRLPNDTSNNPAPLYTPYGYSEQMAVPGSTTSNGGTNNQGLSGGVGVTSAKYPIHDTIGLPNDQAEPWDYFPFNDRDFTSVAELMLVPGCPPGLFTKQFVELAPMPPSTTALASPPTTFPVPQIIPTNPSATTPTSPYTDTAVAPATYLGRSRPTPQSHFRRRRKALSCSRILTRTSWISSSTAATEGRLQGRRFRLPTRAGSWMAPEPTAGSRCSSSSRCPASPSGRSARWPRVPTSTGQDRT